MASEQVQGEGSGDVRPGLLHSIGDAARLVGVSRGMLRVWEREQLVAPRRTPGGHRLYSADDLQRLRQIARMRRVEQLNAAAIRRILGPASETPDASPSSRDIDLGRRLRALRREQRLSLATVAEKTGLSVSFLSAVELGQSSISVGNLFKLADAYGRTVPGLGPDFQPDRRRVIRPQDRPRYVTNNGLVTIEDLIATPGALEAQRIEILPGGGSEESYAHPGEEFIFVLAGELIFWLSEEERYDLRPGDSLYFRSTQPHRWSNETTLPATVLWVNVPVVEPGGPDADRRIPAHYRATDVR